MCGIAGIVGFGRQPADARLLEAMTHSLAHRGPDGEGYVLLSRNRSEKPISAIGRLSDSVSATPTGYAIGFGHRRLAILDRSTLGHQPMGCEQGDVWITYNGEIYNYRKIRDELGLPESSWQSNSDTEVIVAAYAKWGVECLTRFHGMFALAIWDRQEKVLFAQQQHQQQKKQKQ